MTGGAVLCACACARLFVLLWGLCGCVPVCCAVCCAVCPCLWCCWACICAVVGLVLLCARVLCVCCACVVRVLCGVPVRVLVLLCPCARVCARVCAVFVYQYNLLTIIHAIAGRFIQFTISKNIVKLILPPPLLLLLMPLHGRFCAVLVIVILALWFSAPPVFKSISNKYIFLFSLGGLLKRGGQRTRAPDYFITVDIHTIIFLFSLQLV